jgi:hypothetical protein
MVKFTQSVIAAVLITSSQAFVLPGGGKVVSPIAKPVTKLEARSNENNDIARHIVGGATAFVAGLTFAANVAFADPSVLVNDNIISTGKIKYHLTNFCFLLFIHYQLNFF